MASSVALVSERNSNQTSASPPLHPSVSGDQDPAAALWGSHQDYTQARQSYICNLSLFMLESVFCR